jgi:hypothetical protein
MIAGGSDGTAATIVRGRASGYRRDPQAAGRWGRGRAPGPSDPTEGRAQAHAERRAREEGPLWLNGRSLSTMWSSRDVLKVSQWSGDGPGSAASHTVMPRIAVVELHHDRAPLRRLNTASCFTSSPRALGRGARMIPGRVRRLRRAGDHGRRHPSATAARGHRRSPGRPRPGTMLDVARGRGTGRPRAEPRASAATGAARTGPAARVGRHRRRHRRGAVVAAAQRP